MAVSSALRRGGARVGMDEMGARLARHRPRACTMPPVAGAHESLDQNKDSMRAVRSARVEPSDESFLGAIAFNARPFDAMSPLAEVPMIDRRRQSISTRRTRLPTFSTT
jgi:hypothetical protein